jgi:hypothetical protein
MSEQEPNLTSPETDTTAQEPFIPPRYFLILAGIGFLIALVVLLTQPTFSVVGYGGLAFGIFGLIGWVAFSPNAAGDVLSGRALRYGGASILITILLIVAMAVLYLLARGANIRADLTESDEFSLTEQSRQAMESLAVDPTIPNVRILAFYDAAQAGNRDRDTLLLQEYAEASGGKVSFEFFDPDQRFDLVGQYSIPRAGALAVTVVNADGTLDAENAEVVNSINQGQLTNAILQVAAQGDFAAYFLVGQNTVNDQMSIVKELLTTRFDWTVRDLSLLQLTSPEGEFRLNDEVRDGEVVVIPGGVGTFTADELQILTDYINGGGDVIVFAASSFDDAVNPPLAVDAAWNDYLFTNFGVRMNNDLVIDPTQAFQSPLIPVVTTFDQQNFISSNGLIPGNSFAVLETPHSITVADVLPANISLSRLMQTSTDSYIKADVASILAAQDSNDAFTAAIARAETDAAGPAIVGAAAENNQTGARVVLFGSAFGRDDLVSSQQIVNFEVTINSLIWTTNFNDFFQTINVTQDEDPTQAPIFASEQQQRDISFWTQVALPFGILALGGLVLYLNRERRRTT